MKLALLGYTPTALAFAVEASRLGQEVAVAYNATEGRYEILDALPTVQLRSDWESLLAERTIDAVIVAGPMLPENLPSDVREQRDDQLRKLIQGGVPLIVVPPVCEAIVGFELEMIRKDTSGVVVPAIASPLHSAIDDLTDWLSEKSRSLVGRIELVSIERYLPLRQRADVLAGFCHDATLLRRLVGPLKRITASGGGPRGEEKPSLASVTVSAEADVPFPIRWEAGPAAEFAGARIVVQGELERVVLNMPEEGAWRLMGPGIEREYDPFNTVAAILEELRNAVEFKSPTLVTWIDACRAIEAMEAIDRSLTRGRAVDLYNEEHSEESSFKGIMAASGCLLLLGTLATMICAGALTVVLPPQRGAGASYWGWMQTALIGVLGVFLLAQLLSLGLSQHLKRKRQQQDATDAAKDND